MLNSCECQYVLICVSKGQRERGRREMIDAGVRVHAGVDIYGPCSGLACCGLGAFRRAEQKPQRPTGSAFWL